jgi:hypothetical protein
VAETVTGVVAKHLTEPPVALSRKVEVTPGLERAVMRGLSKDSSLRQADAGEFAKELQAAIAESRVTLPITPAAWEGEQAWRAQKETRLATGAPPAVAQASAPPYQAGAGVARKSRTGLVVALVLGVMVMLAGAAAGLWLLYKSRDNQADNRNVPQQASVTNLNSNAAQDANRNAARGNENKNTENKNTAPVVTPPPLPANANIPSTPVTTANANGNANGNANVGPNVSPRALLIRAESKILVGALLTEADIAGLSQADLRLLRNTVYARHGRTFERPDLQRYFNSRSWYKPRYDFNESELSPRDRANIEFLLSAEKSGGKY